jgi:hypothetical protein
MTNLKINFTRTLVFLSVFFLSSEAFSQPWKRNRTEVFYSLGPTNFLGELGGRDQIGSTFIMDLEPKMTRPSSGIGMRYKLSQYTRIRGSFQWGRIKGDDALTNEFSRSNRNLHFRSNIWELAGVYEYYFNQEQTGHRYNIKGARGMKAKALTYYAFAGLGMVGFNPKAQYEGKWVALRPLGTEGQGLPGGPRRYLPVTAIIPMGIGTRYTFNKVWKITFELTYVKTFSDYMDDVSGVYYDNDALRRERGDMAANLADPTLFENKNSAGEIRGFSHNKDAYLHAMFSVNYAIQKKSSRAKF